MNKIADFAMARAQRHHLLDRDIAVHLQSALEEMLLPYSLAEWLSQEPAEALWTDLVNHAALLIEKDEDRRSLNIAISAWVDAVHGYQTSAVWTVEAPNGVVTRAWISASATLPPMDITALIDLLVLFRERSNPTGS